MKMYKNFEEGKIACITVVKFLWLSVFWKATENSLYYTNKIKM